MLAYRCVTFLFSILIHVQQQLRFAVVAPDAPRGQVDVKRVARVHPVMVGVVVIVVLGAPDTQAVLIQAHPQVRPERLTVGANEALKYCNS